MKLVKNLAFMPAYSRWFLRAFYPSFTKLPCRAARGSTTDESQDCSVPAALSQSCPKVCLRSTLVGAKRVSQARSAGLSAAYGRSTLRSGRC